MKLGHRRSPAPIPILVGISLVLILGCAFFSYEMIRTEAGFREEWLRKFGNGVEVDARVVDNEFRFSKGVRVYVAVLEYYTGDGAHHRVRSFDDSSTPWAIGTTMRVRYNRHDHAIASSQPLADVEHRVKATTHTAVFMDVIVIVVLVAFLHEQARLRAEARARDMNA